MNNNSKSMIVVLSLPLIPYIGYTMKFIFVSTFISAFFCALALRALRFVNQCCQMKGFSIEWLKKGIRTSLENRSTFE